MFPCSSRDRSSLGHDVVANITGFDSPPPPLPPSFRGHVLEDGLAALGSGGRAERQTKKRLIVMYTGAAGHEESGIDMGGLFKDFWTDLSALSFDINYGLFR